jgi:hypothetical protein
MTTALLVSLFASVYGSGTYNSDTYNGTSAAGNGSGGGLTNTGIMIGLVIGISALILLIAMFVRIWKRPSRNQQPETKED